MGITMLMRSWMWAGYLIALALCAAPCARPAPADEANALEILAEAGIRGGVAVLADCGDGRLALALGQANERLLVQGLTRDAAVLAGLRAAAAEAGLAGRVTFDAWDGHRLPYIEDFVNLLIVAGDGTVDAAEAMRALAPGGVALRREADGWAKTAKAWPSELDDWPHYLGEAGNTAVSADERVAPPGRIQWVCGPAWSKHHEKFPPTVGPLVTAGGRVFYIEDTTPPSLFNVKAEWRLTARDAFNGALLWRRPLPAWFVDVWPGTLGGWSGGPMDYHRRLAASPGLVFVTPGQMAPVTALDAASGEIVRTFGAAAMAQEIALAEGALFLASRKDKKAPWRVGRWDIASGAQAWEGDGGFGFAVAEGRVYFQTDGGGLGALDAATGRELWRAAPPRKASGGNVKPNSAPLIAGAGIVIAPAMIRGGARIYAADSGKPLWEARNEAPASWFHTVSTHLVDDLVWVTQGTANRFKAMDEEMALGLDPVTGEVRRSIPNGAIWNTGHHQRCYPSKATSRFLIYSRRGADFLDLQTGAVGLNHWMRGTCTLGVTPANGLLYAPPHSCRCYSETALRGLHALAPGLREADPGEADPLAARLLRGGAEGGLENRAREAKADAASGEWPTWRGDAQRSGSTLSPPPADLAPRWTAELGGALAGVTVAGGRVFAARVDAGQVVALDAASGQVIWRFDAGGRIDAPPTIHDGLALFGSADGWLYAARADDGQLAWRFRAAPRDRRLGADGQIESVWPVQGAVLVHDDVAYCVAGRSSFTDGGMWLHGLDAASGESRHARRLHGPWTDDGLTSGDPSRGFVMEGSLPDTLVSDGRRLYLRHLAFDPALATETDMAPNYFPDPQRRAENFGGDHKYWCDLDLELRAMTKPENFFRSYYHQFPGRRLYSTTGLHDDSWHIRSYWSYGQVAGQYLVFRDERAYVVRAYPNAARWLAYKAGDGYTLLAGRTKDGPTPGDPAFALDEKEYDWKATLPLRPVAMILAGDRLLAAGPPDSKDPAEALAALQGKRGASLWSIDTKTGARVGEWPLPAPPVSDGMALAGGAVFAALRDGRVVCLSAK